MQVEEESLDLSVSNLKKALQPGRDNALFQLETSIKKREIEAAQFPRDLDFEPDKYQAQIDNLQIEADSLRGKLEIERSYYNALLTNTNNGKVIAEIQQTTGRELERHTLETDKRLAEIGRETIQLKRRIANFWNERQYKSRVAESERKYRERVAEINEKFSRGNFNQSNTNK